jgi:hypothetical protein
MSCATRILAAVVAGSVCLASQLAVANAKTLTPRVPLPKTPIRVTAATGDCSNLQLIVKFRDHALARALETGRVELGGQGDSAVINGVIEAFGLSLVQLILIPQDTLDSLERRAAERSGAEQPDLAGMMRVVVPEPTPWRLEAVGEALQSLDEVEFAHVQVLGAPPPGDIPPTTPDLVPMQTYRAPDPGMNIEYASSHGATGAGIRLSDCEYGWRASHEDLVDTNLNPEPGQTPHPDVTTNGWDEHGTAAIGISAAPVNGYGIDGAVVDAPIYTYPEWTVEDDFRRVTAITNAIAASAPGDVVLLEMQEDGDGGGYGPAELDPAVWTVVKAGTDAGVVVVAAAGNGSQNLDSTPYAPYMARGDSGAIIVGAGSPDATHTLLWFSTYGSRVNVQGWGDEVFTLGYGDFAAYGGDPDQRYTDDFGGTSSASAMVAAASVLIQGFALSETGAALEPLALRDLLVATGVPQQGGGGHIGPLPDLEAAFHAVVPSIFCDDFELGNTSPWSVTVP